MQTVRSADGTPIAVELTGSGPAVVLIGGAFNDRTTMTGTAAALPDVAAVTYDRRGRGDSGPLGPWPGPAAAVDAELADLAAVLELTGPAVVVGHSSGAALALEAALRGLPVTRLALYEPPYVLPGTRDVVPADDLADRLAELPPREAVATFLREAVGLPAGDVAAMASGPMFDGMTPLAPTLPYDSALVGAGGVPERLAGIAVPTLVLDGSVSPDWMRAGSAATAKAIPGARHQTVPGQDHAILHWPEVFAGVLRRWVTQG